jgi:hypothetical protein
MKKSISIMLFVFFNNFMFSQFSPTGTLLTDAKFRSGAIGLGYTVAPTFGTKKLMVNGDSSFSNSIAIGSISSFNTSIYGIGTNKSIQIQSGTPNQLAYISLANGTTEGVLAASTCTGCYAPTALSGDIVYAGNTSGSFFIANHFNGDIKFTTGLFQNGTNTNKVQMRIDNLGNIGIGTGSTALNPLEKLAVNGLIHTKEVKVDLLNWPDYVFEPSYILMPLNELEQMIISEKHLPEIPSAKEVEENGVLLGEMNKKLLQKVEELTLYMIQMNKEIELLKANAKN